MVSLTPRFIAVGSGTHLARTVSTVCSGKTVKTVKSVVALACHPAKAGC